MQAAVFVLRRSGGRRYTLLSRIFRSGELNKMIRTGGEKMTDIRFNLFPGGRRYALTFSFDDGRDFDRPLVELFNRYRVRGTFHLNSANLDTPGYVTSAEVSSLYEGHETACHMRTHPFPGQLPDAALLQEFLEDRKTLEKLVKKPVRGLSWPYGDYDDRAINTAKVSGLEYSRTTEATNSFGIPHDFMKWHPTAHHFADLEKLFAKFMDPHRNDMKLFYIWGHSYEFDSRGRWDHMENFLKLSSGREEIWYATNIEIKSYIDALKRLVFTADLSAVENPSACDLWFSANGKPVCVRGGEMLEL